VSAAPLGLARSASDSTGTATGWVRVAPFPAPGSLDDDALDSVDTVPLFPRDTRNVSVDYKGGASVPFSIKWPAVNRATPSFDRHSNTRLRDGEGDQEHLRAVVPS